MMRRWVWILGTITVITFTALSRMQAGIGNEMVQNDFKYHLIYHNILDGLGATILAVEQSDKRTGSRSTTFQTDACPDDYALFETHASLSLPQAFTQLSVNHYQIKVIYFDNVWLKWSRFKNTLSALKISFASLFTLTDFIPSRILLILTLPVGCDGFDNVDWSKVWSKEIHSRQNTLRN